MRAEVDWLGQHYAQFEGRRSGLVWFLLLLGVPLSGIGVTIAVTPSSGASCTSPPSARSQRC